MGSLFNTSEIWSKGSAPQVQWLFLRIGKIGRFEKKKAQTD